MLYYLYELNHAVISPFRSAIKGSKNYLSNPFNPLSYTPTGKSMIAMCEMFERATRRYEKPSFDIKSTSSGKKEIEVKEKIIWKNHFCEIIHFSKKLPKEKHPGPKLLLVAPMSGHYATLLRGTVEALLPDHDVHITDWADARMVPLAKGSFDLSSYIDYIISILHEMGPTTHVIAICQPSVPVLAAISLMEAAGDPARPASMCLIGGPIDTRKNPTSVNKLAEERGLDWFRSNTIVNVPFPHPGAMRQVHPGFLQLTGFMSMNLDRHMNAHYDLFTHLVEGDEDSAEKHRIFYDEYLAVMDLTAEFYLQTVETVFVEHALPQGSMMHRGKHVDTGQVRNVALMTIEGEKDDISSPGQTQAAHDLCHRLPQKMHEHYVQKNVGHYGIFNGSRFCKQIVPRLHDFITRFDPVEKR
ncbi:MAG: polyhydroxyalkanoate depolymerase [Alphaproteobacteria bacterium]|nr:polyhydroxyalkanoate depolymerase [Alphaproteobacteria bacterium]